jgi:hypothetical protein
MKQSGEKVASVIEAKESDEVDNEAPQVKSEAAESAVVTPPMQDAKGKRRRILFNQSKWQGSSRRRGGLC